MDIIVLTVTSLQMDDRHHCLARHMVREMLRVWPVLPLFDEPPSAKCTSSSPGTWTDERTFAWSEKGGDKKAKHKFGDRTLSS